MRTWIPLSTSLLATVWLASACSGTSNRITAPTPLAEGGTQPLRESPPPTAPQPLPPPVDRPAPPDRPSPPPASGTCDAERARFAIGEPAGDALLERARVAAGASTARVLRPNEPITTELNPSRLNLGLGDRDVVQAVHCG